ncbi:kinesin motor domain-containing protein, partial [Baffinella frigidus]
VNLEVRENNKDGVFVDGLTWIPDGVFVDGLTWIPADSATVCMGLLAKGVRNRHVGETAMNKESSRSHSLFTLKVDSTLTTSDGLTKHKSSLLNLVDLAGSERQKSTNTTGDRLKEASNINQSLSVLGNVIMALADMSDGKARYV